MPPEGWFLLPASQGLLALEIYPDLTPPLACRRERGIRLCGGAFLFYSQASGPLLGIFPLKGLSPYATMGSTDYVSVQDR